MKTRTMIRHIGFGMVTLFLLSGCGSVESNITVPAEFQKGQTAFHKKCGGCHGPDADGSLHRAPKLIQEVYFAENFDDEKFQSVIMNGSRSGAMPSQAKRVSKENIAEIIKYVRFLQEKKTAQEGTTVAQTPGVNPMK